AFAAGTRSAMLALVRPARVVAVGFGDLGTERTGESAPIIVGFPHCDTLRVRTFRSVPIGKVTRRVFAHSERKAPPRRSCNRRSPPALEAKSASRRISGQDPS